MKEQTGKKEHRFLTAWPVILIGIMLTIICMTLISIGCEHIFLKWEIDNPYVDKNFSGWEEVRVDGISSFSIPEDWAVEYNDGVYSVIKSDGEVWAIGALFGGDNEYFDRYIDFFAACICPEPFELTTDLCPEYIGMRGSNIDKITVTGSDGSQSYYCIQLIETSDPTLALFLFSDISQNADDFNIAEAIMYSFAY